MKKLPEVKLELKKHRNKHRLLIKFDYNDKLIRIVRRLPNALWSSSLKSWHIDYSTYNIKLTKQSFYNIASINTTLLDSKNVFVRELNNEQKKFLNQFFLYLRGKKYSKSTIDSYTFFIADFISFHSKKNLENLNNRDVELFIEQVFIPKDYSVSTHRQFISAVKLFIAFYPHSEINNLKLERPKKDRKLPNVLSQEEIISLIRITKNIKHRAIISLLYSCGLRISEVINLRLIHIDLSRRQLMIKNAKGRKDRFVVLAQSFIPILHSYLSAYKPDYYFVEGQKKGKYTQSSIRKFLNKNCIEAGIQKKVTPHTLRHSYATHLLENGVGLRHIQELLGHVKPETTMIYTHVAKKDLLEIQSPLDTILLSLKKDNKQEPKVHLSGNF